MRDTLLNMKTGLAITPEGDMVDSGLDKIFLRNLETQVRCMDNVVIRFQERKYLTRIGENFHFRLTPKE